MAAAPATTLFSRVLLWGRAQARTPSAATTREPKKLEKGCLRERERERERERTGKCSDCVRWLQQNDLLGLTIKVSRKRERERVRERDRMLCTATIRACKELHPWRK